MELQALYPIVVTDKLTECRDFYVRLLGFQVLGAHGSGRGPSYSCARFALGVL